MVRAAGGEQDVAAKTAVWKQYLISVLVSLAFITHGIEDHVLSATARLAPAIQPLRVPWTTVAFSLAALLAAPLHGLVVDRHGRRIGIYIVVLLQGLTSVPLFLASTEWSALSHAAGAGAAAGGLLLVVPLYVREVSADSVRGATLSLMMLMTSAGNALKLLLTLDQLLFLVVGLLAVQLLVVFVIPESPGYLVKADKLEEAKISAAKLVCLKPDDSFVNDMVQKLVEESERARAHGHLTLLQIFRNKIYRDEMKIGFFLSTTTVLSGCIIFLQQDKALAQLESDVDPRRMLVPLSLVGGAVMCLALVNFIERKYLLTLSYSVMVLSMGTLAVYTQAGRAVTSLGGVPVTALAALVLSYGAVWAWPALLLLEMLNLEIRARAAAVVCVYTLSLRLAQALSFPLVEQYVGVYALLYMFAGVNMAGAVYAVCTPPAVSGRSVEHIERQMRRAPLWNL